MEFKARELGFIIILAVLISSLGMCSFIKGRSVPEAPDTDTHSRLIVHVAGAVHNPGVFRLPAGSRVQDAIFEAGGGRDDADLHRLNLAAHIHDGQRIYVPLVITVTENGDQTGLINLNTANQRDLETLPGIGPEIAKRIIEYRTKHGPFAAIEEIVNVDRIGPKTLENIKDLVSVD